MIVNIIHRPGSGKQFEMFKLQQSYAHSLGLKTTVFLQYEHLFNEEIVALARQYSSQFQDEIGIWYSDIPTKEMAAVTQGKEPFLWLYSEADKKNILSASLAKFRQVFGHGPLSVGSYHMDNRLLKYLKELSPETKISIAGCFEEGVKVFHGCNNSWYLFNEGMPFFPWYPSLHNSLVPAEDYNDWEGIVAVPHLARDMALSYEGRNDFFATHPANVQRAMANEGENAPYSYNLVDMYRYQEDFNDGFSYVNVFVGPGWLSGNPNIQDSDEVTQKLYRDYLEYFARLKAEGSLTDMYMSEFAGWFTKNVPVGKPQRYLAKELLYGSGKHYFWYINPQMRVTFDMAQGGSIGDLRPFVGRQERHTGTDSRHLQMASNPYLIHSQYRSGNSHHSADGARTTLLLNYRGEVQDLCDYPTRVAKTHIEEGLTEIILAPVEVHFSTGTATLETSYRISPHGEIHILRRMLATSGLEEHLQATEYVKGCYGVTEYPEDLKGITLAVSGDEEKALPYQYCSGSITTTGGTSTRATIPQLGVCFELKTESVNSAVATASDGYLFSPFYTLELRGALACGEEMKTCLTLTKA